MLTVGQTMQCYFVDSICQEGGGGVYTSKGVWTFAYGEAGSSRVGQPPRQHVAFTGEIDMGSGPVQVKVLGGKDVYGDVSM